jgi:cytochrome b561
MIVFTIAVVRLKTNSKALKSQNNQKALTQIHLLLLLLLLLLPTHGWIPTVRPFP